MNGCSWLKLYNFVNPFKEATAGLSEPPTLWTTCSVVPGPAQGAASLDSQLDFTGVPPSLAQVAAISDYFIAQAGSPWGKTQVGADLGLHHLVNHRACEPSGQLQSTSEHHQPALAQLILHGGQRLVVSSYSKSLQLTGLGKSHPLICQQQSKLKYKRRGYSVHAEGTTQVSSLGDRGGCATGPYRTPTTLGHTTKTRSQSSST